MNGKQNSRVAQSSDDLLDAVSLVERRTLDEASFKREIAVERKRTERSKSPFLLMLVEAVNLRDSKHNAGALGRVAAALTAATRETDAVGWYEQGRVLGAIFTELAIDERATILHTILRRVSKMLQDELTFEQFHQIQISFHLYPDDWNDESEGPRNNKTLYPDLMTREKSKKSLLVIKRAIDILGSSTALLIGAPLFLAIATAVRMTSRGPVLFRQRRVGQHGNSFTFLKFRSMYVNNDDSVHRAFVAQLIQDKGSKTGCDQGRGNVYKLTKDSRVTPLGRFLRRTSLDELPQFLNVLKGDMSLVGPRPPIPYELAAYETWHRRRLLEVKPGITGLWQVAGRSSVKFDEMVRLDLRYATNWTPWLDLRILLRTPLAVIKGSGAY